MNLSENALAVLRKRYLIRNDRGEPVESPEEMLRRVSEAVAFSETAYGESRQKWAEKFFELMDGLRFLPNSPALMNAGRGSGQLSACFVLPVEDSMAGIFETLKNAALILQSGGGTGFSFSGLRPKDDPVHTTGGMASGPVSFMKIYNTATDIVKQGGARRGANMGILRVDHPDVIDFVRAKRLSDGGLLNFNISVSVTDAFMEAVKTNADFELRNPRTGAPVSTVSARMVLREISESAWHSGDPGVVFIDRINQDNPTPELGRIECTNPCGEQPLLPYEACVLGSLNLAMYIRGGALDKDTLQDDIGTAVRFLDDVIDVTHYPLKHVESMHRGNRKIGLGIMGLADALVRLCLPYDTPYALKWAEETMGFINKTARTASVELAQKRGVFPNFKGSIYDRPDGPALRNATVTTIAPTGTLSLIAGCSSGIEPLFLLAFRRKVLETELREVYAPFVTTAKAEGFYTEALMKEIEKTGTAANIEEVPEKYRAVFKTAYEIHWSDHIKMQAAFQLNVDNAVSKTINLPESATVNDISDAFVMAYENGLKGITVFRPSGGVSGTIEPLNDTD